MPGCKKFNSKKVIPIFRSIKQREAISVKRREERRGGE
jgi:hypothetical protein